MSGRREPGGAIALTGATGFVGRHLLDRFCREGWPVRVLARRPGDLENMDGVSVVQGDLADRDALARLVEDAGAVVHCAGLIRGASRAAFREVNVEGTERLVAAASNMAVPPRFILISSFAAREPGLSHYAASKRGAEDALRRLGDGLEWIILRPPAVYGPGDTATLSLFRLFKRGLMIFPGNARRDSARLSLIYVEDLAAAVAAVLDAGHPARSVFEISDACREGYTWQSIGEVGARTLGTRVRHVGIPFRLMALAAGANLIARRCLGRRPMMTPGKVRELFHPNWAVTGSPLAEYVGWEPQVTIEDGFARTVRWYREHHLL